MKHVFHPTDLGSGSATAFLHALRIATTTRSEFTVMHVDRSGESEWADLPGVRDTLAQWGLLKDANDMEGLKAIGLGVRKIIADARRPVKTCLDHLAKHPTDLIVLSTHQTDGRMSWLSGKVAEPLARGAGEPSLILPHNQPGFVDPASGTVSIKRVLIPVAVNPDPHRAIKAATRILELLEQREVVITLLHVGNASSAPLIKPTAREGWQFEQQNREGDVVDVISQAANGLKSDLVVMTTKGHDGFLDVFRGSKTERVLRQIHCPMLAVPA